MTYETPEWEKELEAGRDELEWELRKQLSEGGNDGLEDLRKEVLKDPAAMQAYLEAKKRIALLRESDKTIEDRE